MDEKSDNRTGSFLGSKKKVPRERSRSVSIDDPSPEKKMVVHFFFRNQIFVEIFGTAEVHDIIVPGTGGSCAGVLMTSCSGR